MLLGDGWHHVHKFSFTMDSYEYVSKEDDHQGNYFVYHGGGNNGICATGFEFLEMDARPIWLDEDAEWPPHRVSGPLTAILAVRQVTE